MKTTILNYAILIEPDTETGTDKPGFTAYCPSLGIADDGDTVDEALVSIKKTIEFHLACLAEEKEEIPSSNPGDRFLANIQVQFPIPTVSVA